MLKEKYDSPEVEKIEMDPVLCDTEISTSSGEDEDSRQ